MNIKLSKLLATIVVLLLLVVLGMQQLTKVTVTPQTLTLPVALKLAAIKTIHTALRTNNQPMVQYSPWYVTYRDGSTKSFTQCAQLLPKSFNVTLKLDIGGNQVWLENYPLRAAFTSSPYHQNLITLLQCIGAHS